MNNLYNLKRKKTLIQIFFGLCFFSFCFSFFIYNDSEKKFKTQFNNSKTYSLIKIKEDTKFDDFDYQLHDKIYEFSNSKKNIKIQKETDNINYELLDNNLSFKYFKYFNYEFAKKEIYNHSEFVNKYYNSKELSKIHNLITYISKNYLLKLEEAEQIVYNVFFHSHQKDLNPLILLSIISVESTFKHNVKSNAGAIGLTQFIPKYHKKKIEKLSDPKKDIWSISGNIKVGAEIFKEYLDISNNNLRNALHRYNGSYNDKSNKYSKKVLNKFSNYNSIFNNTNNKFK